MAQTTHLAAVALAISRYRGVDHVSAEQARAEIQHASARLRAGMSGLDSTELAARLERATGCTIEELEAEAELWT